MNIYVAPFDSVPSIIGICLDRETIEPEQLLKFEDLEKFFTISKDKSFQPILVVSEEEDYFCIGKAFSEMLKPEPGIIYLIPKDSPYSRMLGTMGIDIVHVHEVAVNNYPIDCAVIHNV